jgi:thiamine biosynthesis lipoprotein
MHLKKYILFVCCMGLVLICGCRKEHVISGRTMGTTYQVKVVCGPFKNIDGMQQRIDERLEQINRSMSTYRKDSEISRFNAFKDVETPFAVTTDFLNVLDVAGDLHRITRGAWDGTVNPLVNLWGFGKDGSVTRIPSEEAVQAALGKVGFHHLTIGPDGRLIKKKAGVSLDLGSIAKGYGVDAVAAVLRQMGFEDFLVEIGGEVFAAGVRRDGKQWRVGINQPSRDAALDDVYAVVGLQDRAMATSGDYRRFYQIGDRFYSHIVDPATGYPVQNGVVSASVVAPNCTLADGLATALMVMGPEAGMALLDRLPEVQGLIVVRGEGGGLENFPSAGLDRFIQ